MFNIINKNNELDIKNEKSIVMKLNKQKPTWLDYVAEGCGRTDRTTYIVKGICFLIGNVYFAYAAFGVGCTIFDFTFCDVSLFL
ncbi:MAG: hypothetical protein U1F01_00510 [Acinetobacter sp.]